MKKHKGILPANVLPLFAMFAVSIFIIILVVSQVRVAMNAPLATLNDASVNNTVANAQTNFNNAMTLLPVALIAAAAVIILAVFGGFGGGRRR